MSGFLAGVDQHTRLAGHNRLELLLFRLLDGQTFGINVFKVQEVVQCPELTGVPESSDIVLGITRIRGKTIPVLDLSLAVGGPPTGETGGIGDNNDMTAVTRVGDELVEILDVEKVLAETLADYPPLAQELIESSVWPLPQTILWPSSVPPNWPRASRAACLRMPKSSG